MSSMGLKSKADVVVVGGGVNGCSIAYNLAKMGIDVALVERKYLTSGATGRTVAGIRQQFTVKETIRLAMENVRMWERLDDELGCDTEYTQHGYLFLAHTEDEVKKFKRNIQTQRGLGLDVEFLEAKEIKEIVPLLDVDRIGVKGASWCPTDGHANPFKATEGFAQAARKLEADIYTYTEVLDLKLKEDEIVSVWTSKGEIKTKTVVNAAGAYSRDIAKMAGVILPNRPARRQVLATDPLEPVIGPLVLSFRDHFFIKQHKHGEILTGHSNPDEPFSYNIHSDLRFLKESARLLARYVPAFKNLNIIRQWAGLYDLSPDSTQILGPTDGVEGLIQVNGFSGHGFMVAPIVGKLISELIVDGKTSLPIDCYNLRRFKEKRLLLEGLDSLPPSFEVDF